MPPCTYPSLYQRGQRRPAKHHALFRSTAVVTVSAHGAPINNYRNHLTPRLAEELPIPRVNVGRSTALETQPPHANRPICRAKQRPRHSPKMCLVSASSLPDSSNLVSGAVKRRKAGKTNVPLASLALRSNTSRVACDQATVRTTTSGQQLQRAQLQGEHASRATLRSSLHRLIDLPQASGCEVLTQQELCGLVDTLVEAVIGRGCPVVFAGTFGLKPRTGCKRTIHNENHSNGNTNEKTEHRAHVQTTRAY